MAFLYKTNIFTYNKTQVNLGQGKTVYTTIRIVTVKNFLAMKGLTYTTGNCTPPVFGNNIELSQIPYHLKSLWYSNVMELIAVLFSCYAD